MNFRWLRQMGLGIGIVIIQVVFFQHLDLFSMHADFVLLFLIWFIARKNRTGAILMAALLGFTQDALLGTWGLNMFTKVLLTFGGYHWISKKLDTQNTLPQVLAIVFITALAHNLIFLLLSNTVQIYTAESLFWRLWIGNSIYTTFIAGIIQLFRTR